MTDEMLNFGYKVAKLLINNNLDDGKLEFDSSHRKFGYKVTISSKIETVDDGYHKTFSDEELKLLVDKCKPYLIIYWKEYFNDRPMGNDYNQLLEGSFETEFIKSIKSVGSFNAMYSFALPENFNTKAFSVIDIKVEESR